MSKADEIICPTCRTANSPERRECFVCGEALAVDESLISDKSPESKSPTPDGPDEESEEMWLDELAQLGGEEERVPIDQAWPSPDWLEPRDEQDVDPADDLLNWLREEEKATEADSASEEPSEEVEEEQAVGSAGETSGSDWLDEVNEEVDAEEASGEAELIIDAVREMPEDELPDWLADLALTDEWSELADQGVQTEDLEEEEPDQASLPLNERLDPTNDLANVPERLAKRTLPSWLSDQFSDLGDEQNEANEHGPDHPDMDVAGDRSRIDEFFPEEDVDSRQMAESESEQPGSDGVESSELSEDQEERTEIDEWGKVVDSPNLSAEDLLDEGLEEELDWFLDDDEQSDQATLAPLKEQTALLADLQDVGEVEETRPSEQVQGIIEASEVEVDPSWLVSLTSPESEKAEWESRVEDSGPLSGLRGVLDRPQAISLDELSHPEQADALSNEIVRRTALLERLTRGEPEPGRLQGALDKSSATIWPRTILGLLLITLLLVGWLAPFTDFQIGSSSAASNVKSAIDNAAGKTALLAFDYAPAWSGELDLAAEAILDDLVDSGIKVMTVSQSPAGVGMANLAVQRNGDVDHASLGLLPGEAVGLRNLAVCVKESVLCENNFGMKLDDEIQANLNNLGLIVVLAAERDELTRWIEQVGGIAEIEMIAGVTQSLGPVAKPYVASGQLAGLLASPADIASYIDSAGGNTAYLSERASSQALASWLSVGVLLFALIYSGVSAVASKRPG